MFETLETRRLLAATAVFDAGIVKIVGSPDADHVAVGSDGTNLIVLSEGDVILTTPLDGVSGIDARLLEGDDAFTSQPSLDIPMSVFGGAGNDRISTGAGDDLLDGGADDDLLIASGGADNLVGGDGIDTVSYAAVTKNVRVTLDNQPNDGIMLPTPAASVIPDTEHDNVHSDIEIVIGGSGNDQLIGGPGRDVLNGGPGNDLLIGNGGPDDLIGGPGFDTVDYSNRTANLRITLDNLPNDGEVALPSPLAGAPAVGEGDNVHSDIEHVIGGSGDDFIALGPVPVAAFAPSPTALYVLQGGPGNDTLVALPPATAPTRTAVTKAGPTVVPPPPRIFAELDGGPGDDRLVGSNYNDVLLGGPGNDSLAGNDGNDILDGGTGTDLMAGAKGDDLFRARDGEADSLDGGDGNDRALIDNLDILTNIEQILP